VALFALPGFYAQASRLALAQKDAVVQCNQLLEQVLGGVKSELHVALSCS
jgi:hypothetical protein